MRPQPPAPRIVVPRRIADQVNPAAETAGIPTRVNLRQNAPPFDDELREEQTALRSIAAGTSAVIATLRRPWVYVGYAVFPDADTASPGVVAFLRSWNQRFGADYGETTVAPGKRVAFVAQIIAARAELVVRNDTDGVAVVRGAIWGMSEK